MVRYVYVSIRELNSTLSTSPSDLFAGRYHNQLHNVRNEPRIRLHAKLRSLL